MFDQTVRSKSNSRQPIHSARVIERQVAEHFANIDYERVAAPRAEHDRLHFHRSPISVVIGRFAPHTKAPDVEGKIWVNTGNCIQLMTHAEYAVGATFGHWRKATFTQFHTMTCVRG